MLLILSAYVRLEIGYALNVDVVRYFYIPIDSFLELTFARICHVQFRKVIVVYFVLGMKNTVGFYPYTNVYKSLHTLPSTFLSSV